MKILSCVLVLVGLVALAAAAPASAGARVGVVGGVNVADLDADFGDVIDKTRTTFGLGGMIEFDVNDNLSIAAQPMYIRTGEKITDVLGPQSITLKPAYLEIPVLLKTYFIQGPARPYVMAGPAVGFLISHKVDFDDPSLGMSAEVDFKDISKTTNFSLLFGGGVSFGAGRVGGFVDGRYSVGVTNLNEGGTVLVFDQPLLVDPIDVKTRGFQIMAGVTTPLGFGTP